MCKFRIRMLRKCNVQITPIYNGDFFLNRNFKLHFFKGGGNQNVNNMETKYNNISEGTVVTLVCNIEKLYIRLQSCKLLQ